MVWGFFARGATKGGAKAVSRLGVRAGAGVAVAAGGTIAISRIGGGIVDSATDFVNAVGVVPALVLIGGGIAIVYALLRGRK